ncbi:hypothetical protein QQS21_012723 [Conoideocrella luteorostrata]|uniref:Enterotoxin n=1 Tax=Conoideocrella luteorostrata TaxID=1105319 RepID=A0AAJ0CAZ7_9HYPO|nr:hypothetical protein QQS21_012723 [Conoideocrella luteorostrata]
MDTPANARREGGIFEFQDANPTSDEAWGYNTNEEESGFTLVTRNLNEARDDYFQSFPRAWVYRIAASPNIVPRAGLEGYTHAALGGVLWSQVQAYAPIDSGWNDAREEFHWQDNLDYDHRWDNYGPSRPQPLLSGDGRPEGVTSRDLARQYMNELTSPQNQLLNENQRNDLRELLDWNPEKEPKRDFPLIRHQQPPSLISSTLRQFDWSTVDIPDHLRMVMKDGIPTSADCTRIIRKVVRTHLESTAKQQKRNNEKTKQGDECEKLASIITKQNEQANNQSTPTSATHFVPDAVRIVYHADYLWPDEAKKQGGFLPALTTPPGPKYEVEGMDPAADVGIEFAHFLIPTYLTFGAAADQAARIAAKKTKGFAGVVYVVHATPNIISSGNRSAAVAGIRWSQVMGWMQVPQAYSPPEINATTKGGKRQLFEKAFKENKNLFQPNKDYDRKFTYDTESIKYKTTTKSPQSLSTLEDLVPFMNQNGQAVGWKGTFPLFEASNAAQSDESTKAKAKNAIPAPHEPSGWEKTEKYIKSHALAIALLPAAIAASFIPGFGEAADAAELAALCTESVESVELAETSSSLTEVGSGIANVLQKASKLKIA